MPFPVLVCLIVLEIDRTAGPFPLYVHGNKSVQWAAKCLRVNALPVSIFKNGHSRYQISHPLPLYFCWTESFPLSSLRMSNNISQNYAPKLIGGVVEIAGGVIGRSLFDSLRKSFTSSSQVQRGDYFMDQSRVLLQNHLQLIELYDQNIIHRNYERLV
jgi:hypothetical protein